MGHADYYGLGQGMLGAIGGNPYESAQQQQQMQPCYITTTGTTDTITVGPAYGIAAPAKPKGNLAWLDEDIARYRVKLLS